MEFTYQDLYGAYRKLKCYFYYDNTSLFIRKQISDFENEIIEQGYKCDDSEFKKRFEKKLKKLNEALNSDDVIKALKEYIDKVDFRILPKNIEKESYDFIVNRPFLKKVEVSKCNFLIDAPIEIHIISVLWLMFVGKHFNSVINKNNYAYQLILTDENYSSTQDVKGESGEKDNGIISGLQLFKPYFIGYQQWRDKALTIATNLLDEKKDATILSLDIQRYFYSVRLNIKKLLEKHNKDNNLNINLEDKKIKKLCDIIQEVNKKYTEVVNHLLDEKIPKDVLEKNTILPLGLLSSGFLGNLYLSDFDNEIIQKLNPAYYGRYVDDILFVFSDRPINFEKGKNNTIELFIKNNFEKRKILKKESSKGEDKDPIYHFILHKELKIQYEKVILEHFFFNESRAAINKFKININKQRSEFRFLPDEEEIDNEFDNEAFSLKYSDSINKLRSIEEFKENKFGASKFLAHKIFLSSYTSNNSSTKEKSLFYKSANQILTFFKGNINISFYSLWEKVATYFIINSETNYLDIFIEQTKAAINNIEIIKSDTEVKKITNKLKQDLEYYLQLSVALPYSLNLKLKIKEQPNFNFYDDAILIRKTNMFRHNLVGISAINFTELLFNNNINLFQSSKIEELKEDEHIITHYLSPRFVHYNELNIIGIHNYLSEIKSIGKQINSINEITEKLYNRINFEWKNIYNGANKTYHTTLYENKSNDLFKITESTNYNMRIEPNKKVGIANIKVSTSDVYSVICKSPNLSKERRKIIFDIINSAVRENCDILVLPELSIPFEWLELLAHQSKSKNIAIIAGLEYYINKYSYAFNCVVTILPVRHSTFTTSVIRLRVKNHYSPSEKEFLRGYRLIIPEINKETHYDLFHWRKSYFSVYNCFELADIDDRAKFKSKVDFIISTELNKDINYFMDIGNAWVRDLHCYFIQVNTSEYGDSKIIQPTKTETKNIVTVKGGLNSVVLVENIDIVKLREFQLKEYNLQKENNDFKPTPPRFEKLNVQKRISDLDDFE